MSRFIDRFCLLLWLYAGLPHSSSRALQVISIRVTFAWFRKDRARDNCWLNKQPVYARKFAISRTTLFSCYTPEGNQTGDFTFQVSPILIFQYDISGTLHRIILLKPFHRHLAVFTRSGLQAISDPVCISWATRSFLDPKKLRTCAIRSPITSERYFFDEHKFWCTILSNRVLDSAVWQHFFRN